VPIETRFRDPHQELEADTAECLDKLQRRASFKETANVYRPLHRETRVSVAKQLHIECLCSEHTSGCRGVESNGTFRRERNPICRSPQTMRFPSWLLRLINTADYSAATKTMLTLIDLVYDVSAAHYSNLGSVSAFINQRLVEIVRRQLCRLARHTVPKLRGQSGRQNWLEDQQSCKNWGWDLGSRLARLFRRCLGVTVRDMLEKETLACCAAVEKHPRLSVKEIALGLGYYSGMGFQRQFKQLFSLTPSGI